LIEEERSKRPVLVFCSEEALASLRGNLPEMIKIKEMETHADMERAEERD